MKIAIIAIIAVLSDKDIVLDMMIGSKFEIETLAKMITETTNPQVKADTNQ